MKDIMAGIDLHSNNLMLALVSLEGQRLFHKKLPCELKQVQQVLSPYRKRIHTIAVESTFNWYWLVDGLQFDGYHTVLANPAAIQQYNGVKHTDDKHDAFWLGEMLRLKILPTAHIYERTQRPVRDLLRRRLGLVRKRSALILSLESLHNRMHGQPLALARIKKMEIDEIWRLFHNPSDQLLAREDLRLIREFDLSIERLEQQVLKAAVKMPAYERLLTIPGIGKILGMTIVLETGDIKRFATPGDLASYGRCVRSTRLSNEKKKGENNAKCGNRYLAWAFVEAANFAQRYDLQAQRFYQRKKAQRNNILATKALACKLAKAAWHVMSKEVDYDPSRIWGGAPAAPLGASAAQGSAAGQSKVSFALGPEVEKVNKKHKKQAGEKIASPAETSQLSDQAALGLHSGRALSSAGKRKMNQPALGDKEPKSKASKTGTMNK